VTALNIGGECAHREIMNGIWTGKTGTPQHGRRKLIPGVGSSVAKLEGPHGDGSRPWSCGLLVFTMAEIARGKKTRPQRLSQRTRKKIRFYIVTYGTRPPPVGRIGSQQQGGGKKLLGRETAQGKGGFRESEASDSLRKHKTIGRVPGFGHPKVLSRLGENKTHKKSLTGKHSNQNRREQGPHDFRVAGGGKPGPMSGVCSTETVGKIKKFRRNDVKRLTAAAEVPKKAVWVRRRVYGGWGGEEGGGRGGGG